MPAHLPSSFLYLLATLIWGSTWMAITFQYGVVSPAASVGYRFILAGLLFLAWARWRGESLRLPWRELRWVLGYGALLFGVSYTCVYEAERHIASGLMAVLNSSMLVFNLIGMRLFFGRPLTPRAQWGAALGVTGIVLVFWPELTHVEGGSAWLGVAFGLAAALLASVGNLIVQRNHEAGLPVIGSTGVAMLAGGALALLISLLQGEPLVFDWRPSYLASLLYLAVFGSVVAFACYFTLIGRIGAGRAGYVAVAVPILALVLSGLFEGFAWTVWTVAGIACAVVGNVITLRGPAAARKPEPALQAERA